MQDDRSQRDRQSRDMGQRLFDRREFGLSTLAAAAAMIAGSSAGARAQAWPDKPVKIIEIYPAGVARDSRTRVLAEKLSGILGQQVYVENRPGASGRIGLQAAANAAPDGYTFTMIGSGDTINRHLFDLPYDIERDFEPVSRIETLPIVAVARASLPVTDLASLIRYAKEHPGELTYASPGVGSFHHMNGLLFGNVTGTTTRHVPYGQSNPQQDLLGGHVDLTFDALPAWLENLKAKNLRALAITGASRVGVLPDVPTFTESGVPAYDVRAFYGMVAPKGTPQPIIAKMQEALHKAVFEPALQSLWTSQGGHPVAGTPAELAAQIRSESERWAEVVRANGVKISMNKP
jgi:tripartite-type tricarboxylate transporter receptor subunit TctC